MRVTRVAFVIVLSAAVGACAFRPRLSGFDSADVAADREFERKMDRHGGRYPVYDPDAAYPVYVIRRR